MEKSKKHKEGSSVMSLGYSVRSVKSERTKQGEDMPGGHKSAHNGKVNPGTLPGNREESQREGVVKSHPENCDNKEGELFIKYKPAQTAVKSRRIGEIFIGHKGTLTSIWGEKKRIKGGQRSGPNKFQGTFGPRHVRDRQNSEWKMNIPPDAEGIAVGENKEVCTKKEYQAEPPHSEKKERARLSQAKAGALGIVGVRKTPVV